MKIYLFTGYCTDGNGFAIIAAKTPAQAHTVLEEGKKKPYGVRGKISSDLEWDVPTCIGTAKANMKAPQVIDTQSHIR